MAACVFEQSVMGYPKVGDSCYSETSVIFLPESMTSHSVRQNCSLLPPKELTKLIQINTF